MQTSIRVDTSSRDALSKIAVEELGGASLDEALRVVLFEHACQVAYQRLAASSAAHDQYVDEAQALADIDVATTE